MRKQKNRTYVAQSQIRGANSQAKVMGANVKLAQTMGETSKVMGQMNKIVDPQKVAKTMHEFEMANAKMEMTEETMNEVRLIFPAKSCFREINHSNLFQALDDILADSDDEDEEQAVINQVLDEIGIEITSKVSNAPSAPKGTVKTTATSDEDKEIEAMLAQLKA